MIEQIRVTGLALTTVLMVAALPASAQELDFAVQAGGSGADEGRGIGVDGSDASTVAGYFSGMATFGAGETNPITLNSLGDTDIFVAGYNPDGTLDFAVQAGGTGEDRGEGIAVNGAGASTVTGSFSGMATFGAGETNPITLNSLGDTDIFVARYNPDGTLGFAVQAGGTGTDRGLGIAVDESGASTVTGLFEGMATFGAGETNPITLNSLGSVDIFVARYNPDGTLVFAVQAGGTGIARGLGIAVDGSGASTVTGDFQGVATFGAGETTLNSVGSSDIFVARYNSDGTLGFAVQAGGSGFDLGSGIAVDGPGASTVTGRFQGMATFGAGDPNQTTLNSVGSRDIFVARYNPDGTLDFAVQAGGTANDEGRGIAVDAAGASTVTGEFQAMATFGAGETNQTILNSEGSGDIFVARYNPDGTLGFALQAGGTSSDRGLGIALDGSGASNITGEFSGMATFGAGETNVTTLNSVGPFDIFVAKYGSSGGSPEEQIEDLIAQVDALVADGVLKPFLGRRLNTSLNRALRSLDRNRPVAACINLGIFVVQAKFQVKLGRLPADDGQALIQGALAVINELNCLRR